MNYTLGSLFDGSGGFPLAGTLCGITPKWAAEVEPYPIAVTRSRFPSVRHLGDVSKVSGAEIEPVDIITFGSPCQDLSVAGKRAGLKHEANGDEETTRSGLFMEAVRIIKEMREATNGRYPNFALWENVPGAFSSNRGEDFRTVLEELVRIIEPEAVMPAVPKAGWAYADSYRGDGWSLAYRVFDAQFWGVPQRRRRIHLVLDLRGERARTVLFKRKGVRGYFEACGAQGEGAAEDAQRGVAPDDRAGEGAVSKHAFSFDSLSSNSMKSKNPHSGCRAVDVAKTLDTTDPNPCKNQGGIAIVEAVPYTLKIRSGCEGGGKGALIQTNQSATLATNNDKYLFQPMSLMEENWAESGIKNALRAGESKSSHVVSHICLDDQGGQQINVRTDEKSPTLRAETHGNLPCVVEAKTWDGRGNGEGETVSTITGDHERRISDYGSVVVEGKPAYSLQGNTVDRNAKQNGCGVCEGVTHTLNAVDRHAVAYLASGKKTVGTLMANAGSKLWLGNQEAFSGDYHIVEETPPPIRYIVRRLTPTECARLQGFPDKWGHPDHKDSLTAEEYRFWLNVRNTHAAINGKAVKEYTEAQMLAWYNKLHTDSAEYKMWGNGIALPPALYCMQGMAEALRAAGGA